MCMCVFFFFAVCSDLQLRSATFPTHVLGKGRGQKSPCWLPVCEEQVYHEPGRGGRWYPDGSEPGATTGHEWRRHHSSPALPVRALPRGAASHAPRGGLKDCPTYVHCLFCQGAMWEMGLLKVSSTPTASKYLCVPLLLIDFKIQICSFDIFNNITFIAIFV